jgi:hypothetical protein
MGGHRIKNGHGGGPAEALRSAMDAVREALADLHRRLVDAARLGYEAQHGRIAGPGELLQLLTQHNHFAWLRQLSELLADLDALSKEPATEELAGAVRSAAEGLVLAPKEPTPFWERYSALLQAHPDVAVAHGQARKLLSGLPPPGKHGGPSLRQRHQETLAKKKR